MKKFTETYKDNKINLNGLEDHIQERLSNLDGQFIDECCCSGSCCGSEIKCCDDTCCQNCSKYSELTLCTFYNYGEIISKLTSTSITVIDLIKIREQFIRTRNIYTGISEMLSSSPVYLTEVMKSYDLYNRQYDLLHGANFAKTASNIDLYEFIQHMRKTYSLQNPVVLTMLDGSIRVYMIKYTGSNGKDGSIKNSLVEIAETLDQIDDDEDVKRAQCLNVSIDDCDDTYAFLIEIDMDYEIGLNGRQYEMHPETA